MPLAWTVLHGVRGSYRSVIRGPIRFGQDVDKLTVLNRCLNQQVPKAKKDASPWWSTNMWVGPKYGAIAIGIRPTQLRAARALAAKASGVEGHCMSPTAALQPAMGTHADQPSPSLPTWCCSGSTILQTGRQRFEKAWAKAYVLLFGLQEVGQRQKATSPDAS